MKNRSFKYISILIQLFLSIYLCAYIIYKLTLNYDASLSIVENIYIYFPIFIQEIAYLLLAIQLYQLPDINKQIDNKLLHFNLILLSLDGIVIFPLSQELLWNFILPPVAAGKIHLFVMLASALLFFVGGLHSNEGGTSKYKASPIFALIFTMLVVNFQQISSPTTNLPFASIIPSNSFIEFVIIVAILAIISYFPSYWNDRSVHNLVRIISFSVLILATTVLRLYFILPFIVSMISIILLVLSMILYVVNLKSYTI
ncbi:MAG: hypothetical protein JJE21_09600 [Spirochaetaceae bacterium]|nr:hypothetical protein [Spirochaetaceae bacterium]